MKLVTDSRTDAEREAVLAPLCRAIESGCLEDFQRALAGGAEIGFVHWKIARAIPWGVNVQAASEDDTEVPWALVDNGRLSIAQLCFHYDRAEMLLFAANAVWPEEPDDNIRTAADRLDTLCTRYAYGQMALINLAHYGAFWKNPQSVKFIALALEYGQDTENLDLLSDSDQESSALIREARMQVAISRGTISADAESAVTSVATPAPPARTRNRQV